ncbi:Pro-Pol polyprotein [Smittium culicis]|uniref:Pro-Pol polyprotein n=1 Tax=Smittium culicis TaxID=133412 RepID=A0A1R1XFV9_9FUNG|nr:Pro-Pol polyprotein [Smittium culicis]
MKIAKKPVYQEISFEEIKNLLKYENKENLDSNVLKVSKNYILLNGELYKKKKKKFYVKVIETKDQLDEILKILHDQLGHFAFTTILNWMQVRYWRPNMYNEVYHYVNSCINCQFYILRRPSYQFNGHSAISGIFKTWFFDFLGPFPISKNGKRYILTGIEQLSGFPWATAVSDETASLVIEVFSDFISIFGKTENIQVDNERSFTSRLVKEFCENNKINLILNTPYHPEWKGMVEKLNSTVRYALTRTCNGRFDT